MRDNFSIRKSVEGKNTIALEAKDGCFPFTEEELENLRYGEPNQTLTDKKNLIRKVFPVMGIKEEPSVIANFSNITLVFKSTDSFYRATEFLQKLCPGTLIPHVALLHQPAARG